MLWRAIGRVRWHQPAGGILLVIPLPDVTRRPYRDVRDSDPDSTKTRGRTIQVRFPRLADETAREAGAPHQGTARTYPEAHSHWRRIGHWWTFSQADLARIVPSTAGFLRGLGATM